jgi:hypothetical protein
MKFTRFLALLAALIATMAALGLSAANADEGSDVPATPTDDCVVSVLTRQCAHLPLVPKGNLFRPGG